MGRIAGVSSDETRERLLDAAARVFELKGYEGATVALIAQEARVSTGAIYAHYPGKAALLTAALQAHRDRATAELFPPGRPTDAATVLVTLGRHLGGASDHGAAAGTLLVEALLAARRDPELGEVLADALAQREDTLAALLVAGKRDGELDEDVSTAAAARFALMLGVGAAVVRSLDLPPADAAEWDPFIARVVDAFTPEDSE